MKLVRINTAANANPIMATVPLIMPAKYSAAITTASMMRMILSVLPMFFFIGVCFGYEDQNYFTVTGFLVTVVTCLANKSLVFCFVGLGRCQNQEGCRACFEDRQCLSMIS